MFICLCVFYRIINYLTVFNENYINIDSLRLQECLDSLFFPIGCLIHEFSLVNVIVVKYKIMIINVF